VEALLKRGAEANARTKEGETALVFASSKGNTEVIQLLLQTDVDIRFTQSGLSYLCLVCGM
jgi:ankyrin repeat protein